jgi:hypothetical protein
MDYNIGDLLKLDDLYYIVQALSQTTGCPTEVWKCDEYGKPISKYPTKNADENGWQGISWIKIKALDPVNLKYIKVIRKIDDLNRKFKLRQELKNNGVPF